jgi:GxxExxY protein
MHTDEEEEKLNRITEQIIGCAFKVSNTLGVGFAEKVYENAMVHELTKIGLSVRQQWPISVKYDGVVAGDYIGDLLVEDTVLAEIKAVKGLDDAHKAQCLNYLVATGVPVCLLINFQKRVEVQRFRN